MIRWIPALLAAGLYGQGFTFQTIPAETVVERLRRIERGGNDARQRELVGLFAGAGCVDGRMAEQKVKGSKLPNVICTLAGEDPERVILVTAHFDKVRAGAGAIDNWSGASLLPSLFQTMLAYEKRRHTFVFVGFTDEEAGLVGAKGWLKAEQKGTLPKVRAMVNLDSLASGPHPLYVWESKADKGLTEAAVRVAMALKMRLEAVNADKVGTSDAAPFRDWNVRTIDFHSLNTETFPLLHTIDDQLSKVDEGAYQSAYRFLAAYLRFLDERLDVGVPAGDR
jgi:Zn-dependent M28 family amino/carboxypeptidase